MMEGKIYFLMNDINHEIFYIGSTKQKLYKRLSSHKNRAFDIHDDGYDSKKNNYIRLMNIDDQNGYNNISIHLIEDFPCQSKIELLMREKYFIDILKPCCNERNPITTKKDKLERQKKYRLENK